MWVTGFGLYLVDLFMSPTEDYANLLVQHAYLILYSLCYPAFNVLITEDNVLCCSYFCNFVILLSIIAHLYDN